MKTMYKCFIAILFAVLFVFNTIIITTQAIPGVNYAFLIKPLYDSAYGCIV